MVRKINHRRERWTSVLVVVLAGLSLGLIWAFFLFNSTSEEKRLTQVQRDRLVREVKSDAGQVAQWIESSQLALQLLHDQMAREPDKDPWTDPGFRTLLGTIEKHIDPELVLQTVNDQGLLRPFKGSVIGRGISVADRNFFQKQKVHPESEFLMEGPVKSRVTGQWGTILWISAPENRSHISILFTFLFFKEWKLHLAPLDEEAGVTTSVLHSDGALVYQTPGLEGFPSVTKIIPVARFDREGKEGGLDPGPGLTAYQKVRGTDLWVVASKTSEEVAQWWRQNFIIQLVWVSVVTVLLTGSALWLIAMVVRLRRYSEVQEALARTDPLTGLLNRRAFFERCDMEKKRADRYPGGLTLVLFDLDHFKKVNDTWGHPTGDQVLREFGAALTETLRGTDALARIGGEEFAVLLVGTDETGARETAERVRLRAQTILLPDGHLTTSGGLAVWDRTETTESFVQRADEALYRAKAGGRNRIEG